MPIKLKSKTFECLWVTYTIHGRKRNMCKHERISFTWKANDVSVTMREKIWVFITFYTVNLFFFSRIFSVTKSNNFHFSMAHLSLHHTIIFQTFRFWIKTVFTLCTFSIFDKKKNLLSIFFSLSPLETRDSRTRCSTKYSLCLGRELFPVCNGHFQSCKSVFFVYIFFSCFLVYIPDTLGLKKIAFLV